MLGFIVATVIFTASLSGLVAYAATRFAIRINATKALH